MAQEQKYLRNSNPIFVSGFKINLQMGATYICIKSCVIHVELPMSHMKSIQYRLIC